MTRALSGCVPRIANRNNFPPFKVAGAYTWKDEQTLELTLNYIEGAHDQRFICHFDKGTANDGISKPGERRRISQFSRRQLNNLLA